MLPFLLLFNIYNHQTTEYYDYVYVSIAKSDEYLYNHI
jgi:hypothetical protein